MFFEIWLEQKGYKIKDITKQEGRELYRQFGREMAPAVRDCTNLLNAVLTSRNSLVDQERKK